MSRSKINENLQNLIGELKEEIKVLKETVITQSNIMEVSELKEKVEVLKAIVNDQNKSIEISNENINDLKETIVNQNKIIVGLISELKVMLKSVVIPGQASTKYSNLFPVRSEGELKEIEDDINDETKYAMVATIKNILNPGGLNKNLIQILGKEIIFDFNVTGRQEKKRLVDYPKFVDIIYRALIFDGLSKKMFLQDLKNAFRLTKNRFYKSKCVKKHSKINNQFLNFDGDESDGENVDPFKT